MATTKCKFKFVKKATSGAKLLKFGQHVGKLTTDFVLQDNGNGTATVFGVDAAGNQVDISAVATLTPPPSSSDATKLTVGAPTGLTFPFAAVGPLTTPGTPVVVTATATWNDGSIGPFTGTQAFDIVAGAATGVTIVPVTA